MYYILNGECICADCCNKAWESGDELFTPIDHPSRNNDVYNEEIGDDVNWEDTQLYCSNCSAQIESAYGDDNDSTKRQEVYELISRSPGIDTPFVCLELFKSDIVNINISGHELATWLREWHRDEWEIACALVDALVEEGDIIFSDDGNLYAVGYQGAVV